MSNELQVKEPKTKIKNTKLNILESTNLSLRGEAVAIPCNRKQYYVYILAN